MYAIILFFYRNIMFIDAWVVSSIFAYFKHMIEKL